MITSFDAVILGILEGITEFLPISSTGHLILANGLLGISETAFTTSFSVIIQLGAILAVVALYWKRVLASRKLFTLILAAFIPTGIIGFLLYRVIKGVLLGNMAVVVWALLIGGIVLILFERGYKKERASVQELESVTYKQAVIIGIVQSLAVIPGVSRSAATIVGGLSLGLSRSVIVEFSFLLAIPTMLAAAAFDILQNREVFTTEHISIIGIGFVVAFISAFYAVRFLLAYIQKNTFVPFGVYRIVLALVFIFLVL